MLGGRAQKLQRGPKIGEGAFGNVYEGLYDGDQRVVLKEYKAVRGRDTRSFYEDELNACRRYSHVPSCSPRPRQRWILLPAPRDVCPLAPRPSLCWPVLALARAC